MSNRIKKFEFFTWKLDYKFLNLNILNNNFQIEKLIVIILILFQTAMYAQTFQTTLVPGTSNSMVQSMDGGYVITGWQGPYVLLTKADSTGQVLWTKLYGDVFGMTPQNKGFDVLSLTDGGFLVCGYYKPSTSIQGAYFIRTDQNGDSIWTRFYASPYLTTDEYYFYEVKQNSIGEFIVAGQIEYDSPQPFDIALMKLDSSGNLIWRKELDLGKKETFMDIEINDTSYTIIGESYIVNSPVHDHFIFRTDSSGNINFSRLYSQSPCCDVISDLIINDQQNFVIAGYHNDSATSYIDFFEFDSFGDTILYNSIPNPLQIPVSGFFRHTNGYIIYGFKRVGLIDDAFVIKVDNSGNEIWRKLYGGSGNDEFYSGLETINGLLAFSGYSSSFGTSTVYLVVTDTSGSIITNINSMLNTDIPFDIDVNDFQLSINCERNLYGPFDICIYNLIGEKMILSSGYSANTAKLLSGIYIIVLTDINNKQKFTKKLLIIN